jgi:hypothetical protein
VVDDHLGVFADAWVHADEWDAAGESLSGSGRLSRRRAGRWSMPGGEDDISLDEKRVYGDKSDVTTVLVASEVGLVAASLSGDLVGEFGIEHRGPVADVAADARVAVAGKTDVLVDDEPTGFGPAVAVGVDGRTVLAADADGRVARFDGDWETVGEVDGPRRFDGSLLAADGVYRVGDDCTYSGLDSVADVAAAVPLAATGAGVYRLGNGWMDEREGDFSVVASDGIRTHGVCDGDVLARPAPGEWVGVDVPVDGEVVDVTYTADAVVAVTESGTMLVAGEEGWRTRELGVRGVKALTIE